MADIDDDTPQQMVEELTTDMHADFTVSPTIEIKHRAFCALEVADLNDPESIEWVLGLYDLTQEQMMEHLPEYLVLMKRPNDDTDI